MKNQILSNIILAFLSFPNKTTSTPSENNLQNKNWNHDCAAWAVISLDQTLGQQALFPVQFIRIGQFC